MPVLNFLLLYVVRVCNTIYIYPMSRKLDSHTVQHSQVVFVINKNQATV